jgi:tetratricopeptide (TPR) repeat protein
MIPLSEHPTPRELQDLLRGVLPGASLRRVLAHLADCRQCAGKIESGLPLATPLAAKGPAAASPFPASGEDYDGALDRALAKASAKARRLIEEQRHAGPAVETVRRGVPRTGLSEAEAGRLRGIPRVEILLELSRACRFSDPERMIELAELALLASRRLDPKRYGWSFFSDLRARAWGELANAYRVAEELDAAASALHNAVRWAQRGSGDLLLAGRLGDLAASLWSDLGRFPLAIQALGMLGEMYGSVNETHLMARSRISLGIARIYNGKPEEAIDTLTRGLAGIDRRSEPALALAALHAIAWSLTECGRYRKARIVLFRIRHLYAENGGAMILLRLSWLDGRIYAGLGDLERAEAAFEKTRAGFAAAGQPFDAALAALDLALVWARQGRRQEIQALTAELIAAFRRHGIAREAMAALLLARRACDEASVSAADLHDRLQAVARLVRDLQYRRARR